MLAAAIVLAALAALAPASPTVSSCAAAGRSAGSGPNHVALVIEHGDGSVVNVCVSFSGATITGKQILDTAGIAWSGQSFGSFGEAVCALDGEPAHYSTCPGKDYYWAFYASRAGGAWQFATAGVSTVTFSSGDAEGFRYVPSSGTPATPPSPAGVCAASPAPTATPTPASTATTPATPRPTAAKPSASKSATSVATLSPLVSATETPAATGPAATTEPAATTSPGSGDVAAATAIGPSPSTAASPSPAAPAPSSGGGVDAGLLLAAIAGGGLGGLAVLRLFAARRPPTPPTGSNPR